TGTFVNAHPWRVVAARWSAEAFVERGRDASERVAKTGRQRVHGIFSGRIDGAVCQCGVGADAHLPARITRGPDPGSGTGANAFIYRLARDQLGESAGIACAADFHVRRGNVFAPAGAVGTAVC